MRLAATVGRLPIEESLRPHLPDSFDLVAQKIYSRVGEMPSVILGYGEKGIAYGLPSGKVLKITRDASEVEAMASVMRSPAHPNLVQVFDVFYAVDDPDNERSTGVGVIVRESIDGTLRQMSSLHELSAVVQLAVLSADEVPDLCRSMDEYVEFLEREDGPLSSMERILLEGILNGVRAARERGICSADFGPNNIGLIQGRPVLFDIGMAQGKEPSVDVI